MPLRRAVFPSLTCGLFAILVWALCPDRAAAGFNTILELLGSHLGLLFLAIAILPAVGVPNCPLLIVGGGAASVVHGTTTATSVAVLAVVTNILWSYWVAAFPLRAFLWSKIEKTTRARWLTRMDPSDVIRATFFLHITPGVPLFIQNYFPGLHRLAYWKYLLIAVPIQSAYTALIVSTSGEAIKSAPTPLLIAALALVAALLAWRSVRADRRSPLGLADAEFQE